MYIGVRTGRLKPDNRLVQLDNPLVQSDNPGVHNMHTLYL